MKHTPKFPKASNIHAIVQKSVFFQDIIPADILKKQIANICQKLMMSFQWLLQSLTPLRGKEYS